MRTTIRFRNYIIILLFATGIETSWGQHFLKTKSGDFPLQQFELTRAAPGDQYLFYSPGHLLSSNEREILLSKGIEILYALDNHVYWVRVKGAVEASVSANLFTADPQYKIGTLTDTRSSNQSLRLSVAPGLKEEDIRRWSDQNEIILLDVRPLAFGFIDVEFPATVLPHILNTPWISYIESIPVNEIIQYRYLNAERGWGLISPMFRGLNGAGMTIGIGDEGRIGDHDDLSSGLLDNASFYISNHSTEVAGVITGSGHVDPYYGFGYAPEARVLVRNFSDILWDAPQYFADYGMTLTNNSYGAALTDCTYIGDYNGTSSALDDMMNEYPSLLHVFASANSGGMTCAPFPFQYATVGGGYQTSKNVLTVGATNIGDAVVGFSSRGPVDDGRLKPEVVAGGQGRFMTIHGNNYGTNSGTSFSSPAAMAIATLLYERYKQLHNDSLPDAALIKNVICNAADDIGNLGPDYPSGFGKINGDRAANILEQHQYTSVSVDHQQTITRTFNVPAGTASVDVMLMWSDIASAPYETQCIVNDLDLILIDPSGDTLRPWKLNNIPSGVGAQATTAADHLNNYEQVTASIAEAGTYTIKVKGFNIPLGPQKAWLSWDLHKTGIKMQSPNGGEVFRPGIPPSNGEKHYVRWDAYGTGNSTFTVQFSTDDGENWETIASSIPSSVRLQEWFVDNTHTDKLVVRVTASNGMADTSDFHATIMSPPSGFTCTSPCDGYLQLNWNAVDSAAYYQIYALKNEILTEVDTTSNTNIILEGFPTDTSYWIGIAGVFPSGKPGLRTRGLLRTANGGNNCNWNHDLGISAITNPVTGRVATSSALSDMEDVSLTITNYGEEDAFGFSVSYQINGGGITTELFTDTIPPHASQEFSFIDQADFSGTGDYVLKVWVSYTVDELNENDTISNVIRHVPNNTVSLPWIETFEGAPDVMILADRIGFAELDEWDASLESPCRIRTFAGSAFCNSGNRALTIDAKGIGAAESGEVLFTLNLDNYEVSDDDVRLSFSHMHHELVEDGNNAEAVWIRGSDSDPFILLTHLTDDAATRGEWQLISGLEISEMLATGGQDFSSSFQVKFSFETYAPAGQTERQDGLTIDDLKVALINRDIKPQQLLHPSSISCGLGNETIQVSVSNTTQKPVANSSISYRVNGGVIHTMSIGTVPLDTVVNYMLTPQYDFSITGVYELLIWVSSNEDDFHVNDTLRATVQHSSFIDEFPYVESFENGTAGWLAGGTNSSWSHGIPGKSLMSGGAEGDFAWTTALTGTHNADEVSYLYSPCFDINGLLQPYLSFAFQYQLEVGYDYAWMEYRLSGSTIWTKLGMQGSGTNWYNQGSHTWNGNQLKWITTGINIPVTDTTVQFRWVMTSDVGVEYEGLAIDQVHVYDKIPIYTGAAMQWTLPVSGNDWVNIDHGGQRILSIHPAGQNLGNVTVSLYKSNQNFLQTDSMYLLSRNWVISSSNTFNNAIQLRAYFTTTEANHLVNASGCTQCIPARNGFDLASLRYSGTNQDGNFSNNIPSRVYAYPTDSTDIIPYENGYYAQWETDSLSEWWITSQVTHPAGNISRAISSGSDDAEEHESNGSVNSVREFLALTEYDGHQAIGLRFKNITIPSGSYVSAASLSFTSSDTASIPSTWIIRAQMIADAPGFTTGTYNISLRTPSAQVVQWSPEAWMTMDDIYSSPDIRHIIQQVIDQSSWIPGNDIVLLIEGTGFREAWSFDGDPAKAPVLNISFHSDCTSPGILFVKPSANGEQDGSSWVDAYRSLEQALDRASHCPDVSEIWIAGGTYSPYPEVSRSSGFLIPPGVNIYGGFQGNETSVSQRIYGAYPTILSGDIGISGNDADNLYHVITVQAGSEPVLLDGVIIEKGKANGISLADQRGSGINLFGKLRGHQVLLRLNSSPAIYNAPGSELTSLGIFEIKP